MLIVSVDKEALVSSLEYRARTSKLDHNAVFRALHSVVPGARTKPAKKTTIQGPNGPITFELGSKTSPAPVANDKILEAVSAICAEILSDGELVPDWRAKIKELPL